MDATCDDLLSFLASSPTPYHAAQSALGRLAEAGFRLLDEAAPWEPLAPGRYAVARGDSAVLAFVVPAGKSITGFRVVGAHTDSPNLRLKPRAEHRRHGYVQLGVEVYGGALLNSWLDRDLGLSGRVVVRDGERLVVKLLRIDRPLLRVPQLAIHLDREVNEKGLVLNRQEHLAPVLALDAPGDPEHLKVLCAAEFGVKPEDIVSSELMLHDVVPPVRGGASGELIFSGRLDNLAMCHAAVAALIAAAHAAEEGDAGVVPLAVLFDHEEVGSGSAYGAGSPILPVVLERILLARGGGRADLHRAIAGSICVSADMAHAVHPNYPDRHEANHKPVLNGGPVIKINSQQRYATCARTAALFQELCRELDVPVQHYAHRTDLPCGTTIGPITATLLGMRTVDVGNPMLSMHSIRELGGARDPGLMTRALGAFYTSPDRFA
jgi:aspartyl aminopeptidase